MSYLRADLPLAHYAKTFNVLSQTAPFLHIQIVSLFFEAFRYDCNSLFGRAAINSEICKTIVKAPSKLSQLTMASNFFAKCLLSSMRRRNFNPFCNLNMCCIGVFFRPDTIAVLIPVDANQLRCSSSSEAINFVIFSPGQG